LDEFFKKKFRKFSPNYSTQKKIPKFPLNFFVEKKGEISQGKKKNTGEEGKQLVASAGDAVRKSLVHASQISNAVEGGVDYRRKNGEGWGGGQVLAPP
jgi:hypothetical protein